MTNAQTAAEWEIEQADRLDLPEADELIKLVRDPSNGFGSKRLAILLDEVMAKSKEIERIVNDLSEKMEQFNVGIDKAARSYADLHKVREDLSEGLRYEWISLVTDYTEKNLPALEAVMELPEGKHLISDLVQHDHVYEMLRDYYDQQIAITTPSRSK